jgi:hypothetical protein
MKGHVVEIFLCWVCIGAEIGSVNGSKFIICQLVLMNNFSETTMVREVTAGQHSDATCLAPCADRAQGHEKRLHAEL